MTTKYKLYRNAGYYDNKIVYIDKYDTMGEATDALIEKALDAGLMFRDYEIRRYKE